MNNCIKYVCHFNERQTRRGDVDLAKCCQGLQKKTTQKNKQASYLIIEGEIIGGSTLSMGL